MEKGRSELSLEERIGVYQVDKGRGLASQRDKDKKKHGLLRKQ